VKDALKTMRKKKAPCLSVVDSAGALKGILSIDDILLQMWKAGGKKSRKLIYIEAARAFHAICKPRLLKLARSSRGKKGALLSKEK
jgi:CBS domain-containing protein